jgi:hypothetical protein
MSLCTQREYAPGNVLVARSIRFQIFQKFSRLYSSHIRDAQAQWHNVLGSLQDNVGRLFAGDGLDGLEAELW